MASPAAISVGSQAVIPGLDSRPVGDPAAVNRLVQQGAYFSLFSLPNPSSQSTGIPLIPWIPQLAYGFSVHEELHRFEVTELGPTADCGLRVEQWYGAQGVAQVSMQMTPMPNNFQAGPDRVPPPTLLLPLSQRFTPLNGSFNFLDASRSGFGAVGAGRTLPVTVAATGASQTLLAAVIDVQQPTGSLAGLQGTGIIIGDIQPPSAFHFNVMFRFVDPGGLLSGSAPILPLDQPSDPEPGVSFLPFLAEPDPAHPLRLEVAPDGQQAIIYVHERLRKVELAFAVGPPGLRSRTVPGPVVGKHRMRLIVDLSNPGPVLPAFSRDGEFVFFDEAGRSIGGFQADLLEARLLATSLPGLGTSILRLGGFAPPTAGTGQFRDPVGMVSVNGALSIATGALSTLYMVRLTDPLGLFRVL